MFTQVSKLGNSLCFSLQIPSFCPKPSSLNTSHHLTVLKSSWAYECLPWWQTPSSSSYKSNCRDALQRFWILHPIHPKVIVPGTTQVVSFVCLSIAPGGFLQPHCITMSLHHWTIITDFWALVPSSHLTRWTNVKIPAFPWTASFLSHPDWVSPFPPLYELENMQEQIKQPSWVRYQLQPQICFLLRWQK